MKAEIITIGDEILIGQIIDTNSSWMAQQLNLAGIQVSHMTSVADRSESIINALNAAKQRASVILITGGLGPTKDDITKTTLCNYFGSKLAFDERAYADVERLFRMRGRQVTEINRKQAELPDNCIPLYNRNGTAPGMWFDKDQCVFISLPGVPFEMKPIMAEQVIPKLKEKYSLPFIFHKTILTQGIGESALAELIEHWEDQLPAHIRLAYLPSPGRVRLRLSATGESERINEEVMQQAGKILPLIEKYVYGFDEDSLEEIIGRLLIQRNEKLAIAESCTGGFLSHLITSIPGSSGYFLGSVVAYDNSVKHKELDIAWEQIEKFGAVSEEIVSAMAEAIRKKFNATYGLSTSGIAGPGGAVPGKPIGTIWIALAAPSGIQTQLLRLGDHRLRNIEITAHSALNLLRKFLQK